MKPRILLGFVSYGPYHHARLRACIEMNPNWQVLGWELSSSQLEYGWQHRDSECLHTVTTTPLESFGTLQWLIQVWQDLNNLQPMACVIAGYSHPGMLAAFLWCRFHRRAVVIMSDSTENNSPRWQIVEWIKSKILRMYDSALVAGRLHRDYFVRLNFPINHIQTGYDVVDNAAYTLSQPKPAIVHRPYFLVVCRFVPIKNLTRVVDAYAGYIKTCGMDRPWSLVICGDGPLHTEVECQISSLGLSDYILLPGFLQMDQLLPFFHHAQAFIQASLRETWGLVVNEAMAAGLPVIVSDTCGCFPDLVQEGVNGFGFNPYDSSELTELMVRIHQMPEAERKQMGTNGQRWINETHSLEHFA
ncbi:MAG: glycosyltransferase family 4 protein, partial [Prosthecobacter sp.]|nr:glycosyltransferase family 4 protein [Prosthecobacter sp.]